MRGNTVLREVAPAGNSLLSDQEIVSRIRAGETALYEVIMRRYNQLLFRLTRSVLRDDDEAEDVMQDAYVKAYISLHQFEGRSQFATWLARIAINEASGRLRKRKRFQAFGETAHGEIPTVESIKSSNPDPEQEVQRREAVSMLEQAVDSLPGIYRSVFVCREIENMTTSETAGCLELTEETVKIRLHRARHMLQEKLYALAGTARSQAFQFMGARCDRVVRNVFDRIRLA